MPNGTWNFQNFLISRKKGQPREVKFSKWISGQFQFHSILNRYFRKFWSKGTRPFCLEIWKSREFPVPFCISALCESAPVPLVVKSYKMAPSLSSWDYNGCEMICNSLSRFLIAYSPRKRKDIISWKIVDWSFRISCGSVHSVCILSCEKSL